MLPELTIQPDVLRDCRCGVADTVDAQEQAARLVHDAYAALGVFPPSPDGLYVGHSGPRADAVVLALQRHGEVIGTVTIFDSAAAPLPLASLYPAEAGRLRGRRVAEAGLLAVRRDMRKTGAAVVMNVSAPRAAHDMGFSDLAVTVHPDAEAHYNLLLGLRRSGEVRIVPGMTSRGAAIFMHVDLADPYPRNLGLELPIARVTPADVKRARAARAAFLARHGFLAPGHGERVALHAGSAR
jgi:hypothetical protein